MAVPRWEHFEHQADIGVRGIGNTLNEAFAQAALAMSAIVTDLSLIEPKEEVTVHCEEPDRELLLVDWLNALIFEMATRKLLLGRFEVDIVEGRLRAKAWGERVDVKRHQPAVEVKGATYTELTVYEREGTWVAQCVVDV